MINDGSVKWEIRSLQKEYGLKEIVNLLFPIGTVVSIATNTKPSYMQYGTWTEIASGRVLMGGSNPGSTIEAGLPDITGIVTLGDGVLFNTSFSGAFYKNGTTVQKSLNNGNNSYPNSFGFKASRSSEIYGRSSTVQPPAYVVKFYRRTA